MMKKLSVYLTIFILVFGLVIPNNNKVHAALDGGGSLLLAAKEYGIDTIVTVIQDRILNKLIDSTVNWAAGGFDGSPSFIDNWDGFFKGIEHDLIGGAFQLAVGVANQAQQNANLNNEFNITNCEIDVAAQYPLSESSQEACDARYSQYLNEFEGCIYGLDPIDDEEDYELCEAIRDSEEIAYDTCLDTINQFNEALQACSSNANQTASFIGNIAQSNYNLYQSGESLTARSVAKTIASEGATSLNIDPLKQVIEGEGNTLRRILGGQQGIDDFSRNITKGGWDAYIALADPHNNPTGLSTLVKGKLSAKTEGAIKSKKEDVQTPNKFLPDLICGDEGKDDNGKCIGHAILGTSASQKQSAADNSTGNDIQRSQVADELSDVLAQALGRLTTGLFEAGFSALVKGATGSSGSSSPAEISASQFSGTYQNNYDVLGISDDEGFGATDSTSGDTSGGVITTDPTGGDPFSPHVGLDGSAPFIGGPEDLEGVAWNEGPEIVVDLREVLEPAINNTEKELEYYSAMRAAIIEGQNDIIDLDRCTPGPDYKWETRYKDLFNIDGDGADSKRNKIAFNEMKVMVADSKVNIPGAQTLNSIVLTALKNSDTQLSNIEDTRQNKSNTLGVLKNIKDKIQADFDTYKQDYHTKLPIFESDWNRLSDTEKLEIFSLNEPGTSTPIVEKYYLFKDGETPESVLTDKPESAKDAIIKFSWDLWRTKKGQEPASAEGVIPALPDGKKQKSNLRYRYYLIKNNLSTEAQVLEAEIARDQVITQNTYAKNYLDDCITFKTFVTGLPEEDIRTSFASRSVISGFGYQFQLTNLPLRKILDRSKGDVLVLDIPNAKTDDEIKAYLAQEWEKQQNGQESDFKESVLISPGNIEQSILGFETQEEKEQYLEKQYPVDGDAGEEGGSNPVWVPSPTSVKNIFEYDYTKATFNRGKGRGLLYCRMTTNFDAHSGAADPMVSNCIHKWYKASKLDYEVTFSGI